MGILKDFKCNNCDKSFEQRVNIKDSNPKCPDCGSETHWLPKLSEHEFQIKYSLRVLCDGFSNKVHKERVV
jgi:putative FmdB family regulatory protein